MTAAFRILNDLFQAFDPQGPGLFNDPGNAGTITFDNWGQICSVTTTSGTEARILAAPTKPGILCTVSLKAVTGNGFNLTVTGGYNADGTTTIAFGDAGDYVSFLSIDSGGSYYWRVASFEGTNVAVEDLTVDQLNVVDDGYINLGTGNDVRLSWNGTYLEGGPAAGMWANAPSPADPQYHSHVNEFFDDFHVLDPTATVGGWLLAQGGGAGATPILLNTVAGGQLQILCAATDDDDGNQLTQVSAPFLLAAGKHLWFEIRFRINNQTNTDVTESDYYFGLASLNEDLTAEADNLAADGVLFTKTDGDAGTVDFTASKGGVNTGASSAIATLVDGGWRTFGFYVNGVTDITPYIDGVAGTAIVATLPDDTSQGVILGCRNGDAVALQSLEVDYVKVVQLR